MSYAPVLCHCPSLYPVVSIICVTNHFCRCMGKVCQMLAQMCHWTIRFCTQVVSTFLAGLNMSHWEDASLDCSLSPVVFRKSRSSAPSSLLFTCSPSVVSSADMGCLSTVMLTTHSFISKLPQAPLQPCHVSPPVLGR